MRLALLALLAACAAGPAAAAYEDEGLTEVPASTDTVRNGDEDDGQPVIQETDEDLAAFVTDYISKDIQLKGAFLIEDKAAKKLLKLELLSVEPKCGGSETGEQTVAAHFKDPAGKRFTVIFHLQNGPWAGLDIFRLELKAVPGGPGKKGK